MLTRSTSKTLKVLLAQTMPTIRLTNQGATFGDIVWDTTNVPVGTYYYQCSAHPNMEGAIYVQNSANTVGGVNLVDATAVWQDITAQDAANNTIIPSNQRCYWYFFRWWWR